MCRREALHLPAPCFCRPVHVRHGGTPIGCCLDRRPCRKEDHDSGSLALPRRPVQRGPANIISAVHVRAPAQCTGCCAQQVNQAGHVARARGGHEAGAPLRPVVHEQHGGVEVIVAPQRAAAHAVQHRVCLHCIALIREQEHDTPNRRPLGHAGEGGGHEHSCVRRSGCALPRVQARASSDVA